MAFNPAGDQMAWANGSGVMLSTLKGGQWTRPVTLDHPRASFLRFSPRGSFLATWEVFAVKQGQNPEPNLHIWDSRTGGKLGSFIQKKVAFWAPQWSKDEALCCLRSPNGEVNFYRGTNFEAVDKRLSLAKIEFFSFSPYSVSSYPIIVFVPGQKGAPGFGKLFSYPNFNVEKDVIAHKSFFQCDRMDAAWSHCGKYALLVTTAEVDKTGASYYGKQQLHFMSAEGDTCKVELAKEGPIYSHKWNPAEPLFCVVYGYMPARATLYNHKCDKVFDFGTGSRNMALFNPQGNILMLGGFGNLRGTTEMWAVKEKKEICKFEAPDSTDIKWSPDGKLLMTSTCAPRLRQGNGFKVWHYTGSLLYENMLQLPSEELWEVTWRNAPLAECPSFPIQYKAVDGLKPNQPVASKQAYRPPGARNRPAGLKLLEEDEPAENQKDAAKNDEISKSAAKNRKRRENARKKKDEAREEAAREDQAAPAPAQPSQPKPKPAPTAKTQPPRNPAPTTPNGKLEPLSGPYLNFMAEHKSTGDVEKDKKIRKLNDKLLAIHKLKQLEAGGKVLEINQQEKVKREAEIIAEMNRLRM